MSMVNADSVQLFAMLKKMQDSISSIETTKKSVKMKYEQLGAGWQDKKYNELGVVVRDCNKALNDILVIMLQAEKYVALLAKSLSEYESVQLGSTNGISASTPQTSSFAVTPSSADTTTFESNTFGSNLAFVQDRLSAERYFSRGNHYEEYRDYWENGNYTFSRNENPELVYVRARDIEGVYLSDRELGNPEGFWTRNGREGWSRETLNDENGNEVEFEFLDLIPYRQNEYVVLLPIGDSDGQVVILQLKEIDDETEEYVGVENEFVLETVFALFKERNKDFFTFE